MGYYIIYQNVNRRRSKHSPVNLSGDERESKI